MGAPKDTPPGSIEAVEITRPVAPRATRKDVSATTSELLFAGRPASQRSRARNVRVVFLGDADALPPPSFDPVEKRIDLFYPISSYRSVIDILHSRDNKLCYFWSSADGSRRRAWLVNSPA